MLLVLFIKILSMLESSLNTINLGILGKSSDSDNNIILSIVEEKNGAFAFYIYPSPYRKNLSKMFKSIAAANIMDNRKEDKKQDGLIIQMTFWHTIKYTYDKHIRDFLKNQPCDKPFMFVPAVKNQQGYSIDIDSQIILSGYKYSKREDLPRNCLENQLFKMEKKMKDK